jgi:hypothetical protein
MKNVILILTLLSFPIVSFTQKIRSINSITQPTDAIESIMKQEKITGLMLGITTKDSIIFSGGFGYAEEFETHASFNPMIVIVIIILFL